MASHLPAPCMLVTEFGTLVHVAVLAFLSLALPRGVERHDCPQRGLFVSFLISVTRIYFSGVCMRSRRRSNQSVEPTGGSRSAQVVFVSQWRLLPVAHALRQA